MLRAIFIGDVRDNQCNVFEYNQETKHFEMINDPDFSYPFDAVMLDPEFIIFAVEGESCYRLEVQNIEE
ncbi:hypothetical protein QO179_25175 [Bacillus stercoris]|nr:hypothetical protein [Bacillus stercoris]